MKPGHDVDVFVRVGAVPTGVEWDATGELVRRHLAARIPALGEGQTLELIAEAEFPLEIALAISSHGPGERDQCLGFANLVKSGRKVLWRRWRSIIPDPARERRRISMKKIYFAHAMCFYGHPEEHQDLATIRRRIRGSKIVNPADYSGHPEKLRDVLGFCLRLVEKCDCVVFNRLLDKVTAGVGKEVNHALKIGKPVFELVAGKLVKQTKRVKYVSRKRTVQLYSEWRTT